MKPLFLVLPLACAVLLLSGCPDAKLPTPPPKVPTPKAQEAAHHALPEVFALHQPSVNLRVTARHS